MDIPVVILCGGKGTRLKEETEFRPKPLVTIGGYPILWHIMKIYSYYGFNKFILCLGYKGNMIKNFFLDYESMNNDFTIELGKCNNVKFHNSHLEKGWNITFVDTGEDAQTGARLKKIERYVENDRFMVTYGDGVADINIKKLLDFHNAHGKIGTIAGVHPSSRFGELILDDKRVIEFNEKPQVGKSYINAGFFIFNKRFFDYLKEDKMCYLEREPLENLSRDNELMAYAHEGFWQCVDTYRELELLNSLWRKNNAKWKVW